MAKKSDIAEIIDVTGMEVEPLDNNVLIDRVDAAEITKGGIVLPDAARERMNFQVGRVKAHGPGMLNANGDLIPMDLTVGELVLFTQYAANTNEAGGVELLMMRRPDIIARFKETEAAKKRKAAKARKAEKPRVVKKSKRKRKKAS